MWKIAGAIALTTLIVSCRQPEPPKPEPVAEAPAPKPPVLFAHRVSFPGQTLSSIAKWYTGDAANWRHLTDPVNTGLTECCARLKVNRVVYLPRDLVTQTKPMPAPKVARRPAKPLVKEEEAPAAKAEPETPAEARKAEEAKEAELPDTAPVKKEDAKPAAPSADEDEEILGPR